jgi:hypothetical protein
MNNDIERSISKDMMFVTLRRLGLYKPNMFEYTLQEALEEIHKSLQNHIMRPDSVLISPKHFAGLEKQLKSGK